MKPPRTFTGFVVGPSNRTAYDACVNVAVAQRRAAKPLFIFGREGMGKTHLLQAIESAIRIDQPEIVVSHLSAEYFANEWLWSERHRAQKRRCKRYRETGVLLLDDIQFLGGLPGGVVAPLHELLVTVPRVVLTSDCLPMGIARLSAKIRRYIQQCALEEIQPADGTLRRVIVQRLAEERSLNLTASAVEFLALNGTKNIRQMEGTMLRLSRHASQQHEPMDMETIKLLLGDSLATG